MSFKDVCSGLLVFDKRTPQFWATQDVRSHNIFTCFPTLCLRGHTAPKKASKMNPQSTCLGLRKHMEQDLEIVLSKMTLFAAGPI